MKYRKCKTNPLNRGFKQNTIISDLETKYENMIVNKKIQGGNSQRRPDVFIDRGDYCIIIEIDERQHRSGDYTSDNRDRTSEIIDDINGRSLVLIRFNPDSYKSSRKTFRSLFSKTRKDRLYRIGCPNKYEERLTLLKAIVDHYLCNSPSQKFIEHRLYFDNFDPNDILQTLYE